MHRASRQNHRDRNAGSRHIAIAKHDMLTTRTHGFLGFGRDPLHCMGEIIITINIERTINHHRLVAKIRQ